MTTTTRSLYIGCTAALLSGGVAHAQDACTTYPVVAGDNLRYIARAAYGDADLFRVIYNANVAVIGEKADLIEVGVKLVIPCDPNNPAATEPVAAAAVAVCRSRHRLEPRPLHRRRPRRRRQLHSRRAPDGDLGGAGGRSLWLVVWRGLPALHRRVSVD